jgi:DNA-binding GntR family transcriptional regulator
MDADLLPHRPLKQDLYEILHGRIIAGSYHPGEWLRQVELATELGVSMTPVREALDLLVAAGLAERVPYRGVRVVELSAREIVESYGMRLLLESVAARAAAARMTREQAAALSRIVDEMENQVSLTDMSRARQMSREFHLEIVRAAGDCLLFKLYSVAVNSFPDWMLYEAMFRHPELLAGTLSQEQAEHRAILAALTGGDAEEAGQLTISHILHLGCDIEKLLDIPGGLLREKERQVLPIILNHGDMNHDR